MPTINREKGRKAAKGMKDAFRQDSLIDKLKRAVPRVFGDEEDEDDEAKAGKPPKGAKDFLMRSLRERRGK